LLPEKELEYSTTSWDQHLTVLNPNHQSNGPVLPPMLKKWANSESGETKIDTRDESFPLFIPATTMSKSE
jgi:hypothetical protein